MAYDQRPTITRRHNGEYSTILLPTGAVETMWYGDDGSSTTIGRSATLAQIAREQIADWEKKQQRD